MSKIGRYLGIGLVVVGGYLALLVGLSFALDGCAADMVEERLEAALDADVEVGEVSLSLLRGHIEVRNITVHREHMGRLDLTIERIDVDTAPLGWVIIDRDPDFVEVADVTMSITAGGALDLPERPKREPLDIGGMHLANIDITAAASDYLPGLAKVQLTVTDARTGPLVMASALDWVFALRNLEASVKLPAGIDAGVHYTPGQLGLSGSVFGSKPIRLPFTMPVPEPQAMELDKLRLISSAIAETVGKKLVKSWLKSKVTDGIKNILD